MHILFYVLYKHNFDLSGNSFCLKQGMTELPDYNKIVFPEMPPIPLENIVPDASPEVRAPCVCCACAVRILCVFRARPITVHPSVAVIFCCMFSSEYRRCFFFVCVSRKPLICRICVQTLSLLYTEYRQNMTLGSRVQVSNVFCLSSGDRFAETLLSVSL